MMVVFHRQDQINLFGAAGWDFYGRIELIHKPLALPEVPTNNVRFRSPR